MAAESDRSGVRHLIRTAHSHALVAQQTIDTVLPLTRAELAAWVTRATTALDFTDAEIKALEAEVKRVPQPTETSRTTIEARLVAVRAEAKRGGWTTTLRNEEAAWLGQLARILAPERLAAAKALAALRRSTQLAAAQTALDAIPVDAVPTAAQRQAVLDQAFVAASLSDLLVDVATGFAEAERAAAAPAPPTPDWIALLTGRKHRAEIATVGVEVGATRGAIEGRARAAQRAVPAAVTTPLTAAEAHLAAATTAAAGLPSDRRVDVQTADRIQWELTQARHDAADALRAFDRAFSPTAAQLRSRLADITAAVDAAQAQLGRADSHITTALPVTAGQTWETAARALEAARHQLDLHGTSPHRDLLEATRHAEFSSHAARDYLTWARSHFLAAARGYLARVGKALDAVPASAATTPQSAALVASVTADLFAAENDRARVRNRIRHARREDVLVSVIRARETLLRTAAATAPPDTAGTPSTHRLALATRLAAIGTDLIAVQLVLTPQRAVATTLDSPLAVPVRTTQGQIWRGREQLLLARAALWKLTGTVPRWPATVQAPLRTAHGHALVAQQTIDTVLPLTRAELAAWVTRATTALDFTDAEIKALEAEVKRVPQPTETSRTTIEARLVAVRAEAKRGGWTTILRNEEAAWLGQLARILAPERLAAAKALAALRRSTQLAAAQTALDAIPEDAVPTAAQRKAVLDPAAGAASLSDLLADVAPGFADARVAIAAPEPPAICAVTTPVRFYATDFKGSVVLTLDENARPCKLRSFEPFGTEQAATARTPGTTANDADDLRYLGARRDPTGFYHLGARYYDAPFGRFLQADPLVGDPQNPQDYNRYAYARNNPVRYFDPMGLAAQWVVQSQESIDQSTALYHASTGQTPQSSSIRQLPPFGSAEDRSTSSDRPCLSCHRKPEEIHIKAPEGLVKATGVLFLGVGLAGTAGGGVAVAGTGTFVSLASLATRVGGAVGSFCARQPATCAAAAPATQLSPRAARRALGKALEAAGRVRLPRWEAHHIVALKALAAEPAREVLTRFGIGINSAINGVFLPATKAVAGSSNAILHRPMHTEAYYRAVNEALLRARSRAQAEAILKNVAKQLSSGVAPR